MKYQDTIAATCRYGDVAEKIFGKAEIIWEDSESDYQGHASLFGLMPMPDGRYFFYEWWYGSCSGCDTWEAEGLDDSGVETAMRKEILWLDNGGMVEKWLKDPLKQYRASRTIDMEVGQMLDVLSGGTPERLSHIAKAYDDWKNRGTKED